MFFMLQGEVDLVQRVAGGTVLLALASLLIFTGRERLEIPSKVEDIEIEDESKPVPVTPHEIDVEVTNPDAEMKRTRGRPNVPVNMPLPPP